MCGLSVKHCLLETGRRCRGTQATADIGQQQLSIWGGILPQSFLSQRMRWSVVAYPTGHHMADWLNVPWWGWIVFGIGLALLELASPGGFYFIFFGVGAVAVGALAWVGLLASPWVQVTFFSIFSIVASILFRRPLLARFGAKIPDLPIDSLVGETATAL